MNFPMFVKTVFVAMVVANGCAYAISSSFDSWAGTKFEVTQSRCFIDYMQAEQVPYSKHEVSQRALVQRATRACLLFCHRIGNMSRQVSA
ncbi:hypothetical protein BDP55DRAFT_687810 [Colletotrichum godetiae]|uniref:Lipoprotein n=1 Tax=Colletotrichum godetiae TaxID=1209918 RepID=A0AAJ0EMP7_9PEZI|nr:uncharacterized protein BDP55DRAFT_687810 [Colletotrichum godetiae]KAK1656792.1 hypothetical protein BDP55DRAFT_687810 [Colletotrichum godetiae]